MEFREILLAIFILFLFYLILIYLPTRILTKKLEKENIQKDTKVINKPYRILCIFILVTIIFILITYMSIKIYNYKAETIHIDTSDLMKEGLSKMDMGTVALASILSQESKISTLYGGIAITIQIISEFVYAVVTYKFIINLIKNNNKIIKNLIIGIFYIFSIGVLIAIEFSYHGFLTKTYIDNRYLYMLSIAALYIHIAFYTLLILSKIIILKIQKNKQLV